ncbi:DUF4386 domain-containing protein [Solicola gregarius]|uniref:DUF4386 domain-containing protein n=1 Tax=Solicola gregarius TaxID=2908642 RepID=A0AA46TDX3_9ACTN|nr:DUF4386 domain-containing protein [Solicola gregarius]UYM03400.1 DUF4386 domain-containing protein [Solicola gregarius]
MSAHRRTALIAGVFFAFTFIASIPALPLYDSIVNDTDYILGSGYDTRVAFGALGEIVTAIAGVGTAVVLFPIVKRQSEALALGYVAVRIVESTIIVVGLMSLLAVVTLRDELGAGAGSETVVVAGQSLVALHDATFLLGPAFCAGIGNGILLGYLMYKSGLVPRRMALIGLIGGPLALITATAVLFGAWEQLSGISFLFTLPEIVWEASLTIWLIAKGFRPCPILDQDAPPESQPTSPPRRASTT